MKPTQKFRKPNPAKPGLLIVDPERGGHLPTEGAWTSTTGAVGSYWARRDKEKATVEAEDPNAAISAAYDEEAAAKAKAQADVDVEFAAGLPTEPRGDGVTDDTEALRAARTAPTTSKSQQSTAPLVGKSSNTTVASFAPGEPVPTPTPAPQDKGKR